MQSSLSKDLWNVLKTRRDFSFVGATAQTKLLKTGLTSVDCQSNSRTNQRQRSRCDRAGRLSCIGLDADRFTFLERTRIATRHVPGTRAVADLSRSRIARFPDLVH